MERWCDKSGEDPALTRLVRGQEALNDLSRSLEQCGITQDTELRAIQLRPQEALRAALDADADSRVRRAVQKCAAAEVMELCCPDGSTKHRRWWRLELERLERVLAVVSWSTPPALTRSTVSMTSPFGRVASPSRSSTLKAVESKDSASP